MACVLLPDLIGGFAVDDQRIVNKQFAAGRDVGERVDEDTITRLNRFAVRCACVIQEAGTVVTATAINYPSVRESEREGVTSIRALPRGSPPPGGQFTCVLNKPLAGPDGPQREESRAMHRRASCGYAALLHA